MGKNTNKQSKIAPRRTGQTTLTVVGSSEETGPNPVEDALAKQAEKAEAARKALVADWSKLAPIIATDLPRLAHEIDAVRVELSAYVLQHPEVGADVTKRLHAVYFGVERDEDGAPVKDSEGRDKPSGEALALRRALREAVADKLAEREAMEAEARELEAKLAKLRAQLGEPSVAAATPRKRAAKGAPKGDGAKRIRGAAVEPVALEAAFQLAMTTLRKAGATGAKKGQFLEAGVPEKAWDALGDRLSNSPDSVWHNGARNRIFKLSEFA